MLNGLRVESRLYYDGTTTKKHEVVIDLFQHMLKNHLNSSTIKDLFKSGSKQSKLAKCVVKMYTMETFLYKTLTKTQRECPSEKIMTVGPFNELFNTL